MVGTLPLRGIAQTGVGELLTAGWSEAWAIATLRAVSARLEQAWEDLPGYLQGDVVMACILVAVVFALTIAYNRGFKRTERGPLFKLPLVLLAGGVALMMRHLHEPAWRYGLLGLAVVIGALAGRSVHPHGLWVPVIVLAALLGSGWALTALMLALGLFLLLFLSPTERR